MNNAHIVIANRHIPLLNPLVIP